jgi:Ca-activated chloride channel family protein
MDLSTFRFGEPLYLWLLVAPALLTALWVWQVSRRRGDARRYTRDRVLPVRERYSLTGDLAFWLCLILATSLCIIALARPQARVRVIRRASADFVILLDGSSSMYVNDVNPDRWQRSVRFLKAFAEALSWRGDRVALALFAHLAAPQVRLTKDPNALFFFLDHLGEQSPFRLEDISSWDTNIEEGIYWGVRLVEKDEELFGETNNPKAFVVVSDGQAWSGDVADAIREARARNIVVHVVGVGTVRGGMIPEGQGPDGIATLDGFFPVTQRARRFSNIRGVLDRESLRAIALAGGGEYFELDRQPDRDVAFRIISSVRRRAAAAQEEESQEELYWRFLFAAAVFLGLGTVLLKEGAELWWQAAAAVAAILIIGGALG